jgi:hypothetical protein
LALKVAVQVGQLSVMIWRLIHHCKANMPTMGKITNKLKKINTELITQPNPKALRLQVISNNVNQKRTPDQGSLGC